jgi:hypothetical protein
VTDSIKQKLQKELDELDTELRVELPKQIKTAKEWGDLRENAEYHAALARQQFVQARIRDLPSAAASWAAKRATKSKSSPRPALAASRSKNSPPSTSSPPGDGPARRRGVGRNSSRVPGPTCGGPAASGRALQPSGRGVTA